MTSCSLVEVHYFNMLMISLCVPTVEACKTDSSLLLKRLAEQGHTVCVIAPVLSAKAFLLGYILENRCHLLLDRVDLLSAPCPPQTKTGMRFFVGMNDDYQYWICSYYMLQQTLSFIKPNSTPDCSMDWTYESYMQRP